MPLTRRHIIAGLSALPLLATSRQAAASPVTLRVAYNSPAQMGDMHHEIARLFMAENPDIRIELDAGAQTNDDLLQKLLRAAVTRDLPDVAFPTYSLLPILAGKSLLVPLDKFIAADKGWGEIGITASALATTLQDGAHRALPFSLSTSIVYYNTDLLAKAGVDIAKVPESWDEITIAAKAVQAAALPDATPFFFEYYNDLFNWPFNSLVLSYGGHIFTEDGKIAFDNPQGQAALERFAGFGRIGMLDMSTDQARQAFSAGKIAIYVASTSRLAQLTRNIKNVFALKTGPFPISAPDGKLAPGGYSVAILTEDQAKQDAAWKYLRFIVGGPAQAAMARRTGLIPINQTAISAPDLLGNFYADNPVYMTGVRLLPKITRLDTYPGPNAVRISTTIRDYLQLVLRAKLTPAEAMPRMIDDVEALLKAS